jgi:hypothetical protein
MSELPDMDALGNDAAADAADGLNLDGVFEDGFDLEESDLLAITGGESETANGSSEKSGAAGLEESSTGTDRNDLDTIISANQNHLETGNSTLTKPGANDEVKSEGSDEDEEDEDDEVSLASDEEVDGKSAPANANGTEANGAENDEDEEDEEEDGADDSGAVDQKRDAGKKRARKRLGQVSVYQSPHNLPLRPISLLPNLRSRSQCSATPMPSFRNS